MGKTKHLISFFCECSKSVSLWYGDVLMCMHGHDCTSRTQVPQYADLDCRLTDLCLLDSNQHNNLMHLWLFCIRHEYSSLENIGSRCFKSLFRMHMVAGMCVSVCLFVYMCSQCSTVCTQALSDHICFFSALRFFITVLFDLNEGRSIFVYIFKNYEHCLHLKLKAGSIFVYIFKNYEHCLHLELKAD